MSEARNLSPLTGSPRSLNLLDVVEFVERHALRLLLWGFGFAVAGYLLAFAIPRSYRATSVILPPDEDELTSSMAVTRRMASLSGLGRLGNYFTQADVAVAILRSRTVRDHVVQKYDLRRVYHVKTVEAASKGVEDRTKVKISSEGTISVTVEDRDRGRAAAMANTMVSDLDSLNQRFRSSRARRTREFLETRVVQSDRLLRAAEQNLALYQQRRGAIVATPELRGALSAASNLMARKVTAEVQLELARTYASPQSDEVRQLEATVNELRRQVGELPRTQVGAAELLRDLTVQQQVYSLLTAQLEEARIRETMDTPTIQVLDTATPPDRPFWPRKLWIALFGLLVGTLLGIADARGLLPRRATKT